MLHKCRLHKNLGELRKNRATLSFLSAYNSDLNEIFDTGTLYVIEIMRFRVLEKLFDHLKIVKNN